MDKLLKDMRNKDLIEIKKSCGLLEFLRSMSDADARKYVKLNEQITVELCDTIFYGEPTITQTDKINPANFIVGNLPNQDDVLDDRISNWRN